MANLQASEDHYRRVQRIAGGTVLAARRTWELMSEDDLDGSWETVGPRLAVLVTAGQVAAAESAHLYVPEALDEQGIDSDTVAEPRPRSVAGVASDGRGLPGLLATTLLLSRTAGLGAGRVSLDRMVATQVADAGRQASVIEQAVRPQVTYYTRMLNPPSCSRCAILAGRTYKSEVAFLRHPRCDCVHVPTRENLAGDLTTDPQAYFDSLSESEQDRVFTKAGAEAIRAGADMGRVVNARRGMNVAQSGRLRRDAFGNYTTREATTSRGRFPGQRDSTYRLMPESIYEAASSREDALRLLRANGYIR